MKKTSRLALPALTVAACLIALPACSVKESTAADPGAAQSEEAATSDLTLKDGWVKATEEKMTGVFGTLTNATDEEIHLTGVRSDVAGLSELHVTVDDGAGGRVMKKAEDGFVIPAGGTHVLEPGGDHLMLMKLTGPIATGEDVEVTLLTEDGREYAVTVTARAFTGAEEHYAPGEEEHGGHGGHDDAGMTSETP